MVGFVGALVGGALKGWGTGTIEEIKQKREEKLKELDRQFQSQENALTRDVQKQQIASQERLTTAQMGVQERLGNLQASTQKSIAELGANTDLTRTQMGIDAQREIAKLQAESAQLLNTELRPVKSEDGKSFTYELFRKDGQMIERPVVDGKKVEWTSTDTDTDEMKNMKQLMVLGVPQDTAIKTIFEAKNANRELAEAGIFKAITDGMSTMKNLGEEDFDFAKKKAKDVVNGIYGDANAPTGASPATAPAAPAATTAPATVDLTGQDPAKVIRDATAAARTATPEQKALIRKALKDADIDPARVPGL